MKKLYFIIILMLGYIIPSYATTVTATITDSDSQTWNNGAWTIRLVNPRPDITPSVNGTPLTSGQIFQSGSLSSGGVLTATVVDSSTISPVGTTWSFVICPNASASCGTGSMAVTGSSVNLSTALSALIKAPRFNGGSGAFGYLDGEVNTPIGNGLTYYNVTTPALRIYNAIAATWSSVSGSGSPYNPAAVAITGGTINGTTIGGTTPAAITGTTITATNYLAPSATASALCALDNTACWSFYFGDAFVFINGGPIFRFDLADSQAGSNFCYLWVSGVVASSNADTGICRPSANTLYFGNGTVNDHSAAIESGSYTGAIITDTGLATAGVVTNTSGGLFGTTPLAGAGAGVVTGPTTATSLHLPEYIGTGGQQQDSSIAVASICLNSHANCPFATHQDYWNIASAIFPVTPATSVLGPVYFEMDSNSTAGTLKLVTARLSGTISCTVAPSVVILDLGTSATTAYGSATVLTTLATGTSDGAYVSSTLSVTIASGHYLGLGFSAGTCVTPPIIDVVANIYQ